MEIFEDTILYFTGTGNSLQIAKDVGKKLGNFNLLSIPRISEKGGEIEVNSNYLGIVCPVYFWGLPRKVDEFLNNITVNKDTYIFAIVNCGLQPGQALMQIESILKRKGRNLSCGFNIRMPDNYIIFYGAPDLEKQRQLFAKEKIKVNEIVEIVKEGRVCNIEKSKFPVDRILKPIVYKITNGFNGKDKNYWVDKNCNICGMCKKVCPVENIEIENEEVKWKHKCEMCLGCIQSCPNKSIQYGKYTKNRKRYKNPNVNISELMRMGIDKNELCNDNRSN